MRFFGNLIFAIIAQMLCRNHLNPLSTEIQNTLRITVLCSPLNRVLVCVFPLLCFILFYFAHLALLSQIMIILCADDSIFNVVLSCRCL